MGVMNPPYMGSGKMNDVLSKYVKQHFTAGKADLFAAFMERLRMFVSANGYYAMITQHAWMFLSSFEKLRQSLTQDTLINMAHLGTRAFEEIGGEVVQSTAFVLKKQNLTEYVGTYERLIDFNSQDRKETAYLAAVQDQTVGYLYRTNQANFKKIPGSPIAYWVSNHVFGVFANNEQIKNVGDSKKGLDTGNNSKYYRYWYEVNSNDNKWTPLNKGGDFRKWYGNHNYVINWQNSGKVIKENGRANIRNEKYYFKKSISWTDLTSGPFSGRLTPKGFIFDAAGPSYFGNKLAYLNSKVFNTLAYVTMSTMHYPNGQVGNMPFKIPAKPITIHIESLVKNNVMFSKTDWDSFENSWDFKRHPLLLHIADDKQTEVGGRLENAFAIWKTEAQERFDQLKANEEELNRIFIDLW
ncbi:Eco57I restriction-modification methylase domain-containing protein [Lactiplantibacillus plantarum]|uniref:Eco57I restriction-modification methylase domain-containing protein n=1 Tax=Lactiplantibacillus plantarum TaxID=1590 RepID=UPI003879BDC6